MPSGTAEGVIAEVSRAMRDGVTTVVTVEMQDDPTNQVHLTVNGTAVATAAIIETAEPQL